VQEPTKPDDEPPPFGGSWKRIYVAVVLYTALIIVLLTAMTAALRR
jgi:hypothetical protein